MQLSKEERFVIYCTRQSLDFDLQFQLTKYVESSMCWNYVKHISHFHRVQPLVHEHLSKTLCFSGGAKNKRLVELETELGEVRSLYSERGVTRYKEIYSLCNQFENAGIEVVVLKGPALGETVYNDKSLRPFGDLDLLMKYGVLEKACSLLFELGYIQRGNPEKSVRRLVRSQARYNRETSQFSKSIDGILPGPFIVDPHHDIWNRFDPYSVDIEEMISDSVVIDIDNAVRMRVLCPEHQLIHLCCHLFIHARKISTIHGPNQTDLRLIRFCDLFELVMKYRDVMNWTKFITYITTYKLQLPVFYGLFFMEELYGKCLDKYLLNEIQIDSHKELDRFEADIGMQNGGFWSTPFPKRLFIERWPELIETMRGIEDQYSFGECNCIKVAKPPVIDGSMEDFCWSECEVIDLCEDSVPAWQHFGTHVGWGDPPLHADDLSAICYTCWDYENLYFAANVSDDTIVFVPQPYQGEQVDNIQLFFAQSNKHNPVHINLLYPEEALVKAGYKIALSITSTGYSVEAAIPWKYLNLIVEEDSWVKFDIQLHDCDNPVSGRKTTLVWSGGRDLNWTDPVVYGKLYLKGT